MQVCRAGTDGGAAPGGMAWRGARERAMKPWANTVLRYGAIAIALHWAMAVLLLGLFALGIYMVGLPEVGFDTEKITLILVHKAVGMLALLVAAIRLAWRLRSPLPQLADGLPDWQQVSARFVHLMFYALMFALPLTGWLMSSAGGYPVSFFGWFDLPDLIPVNEQVFRLLIDVHRWLAWLLAFFLVLHAGAALRHHLQLHDDTLRRMLP
jgi:cytochrome b561